MMKSPFKIIAIGFCVALFATANAQSSDDYIVHTIKKGEILPVLAKKYGITADDIAKLNNFSVNHVVHVGDKVKLPASATYRDVPDSILYPPKPGAAPETPIATVVPPPAEDEKTAPASKTRGFINHTIQKGEVYAVLARKYHVTVDQILDANDFKGNHILHAGDVIKLPAGAAVYDGDAAVATPPQTAPAPAPEVQKPVTVTAPQADAANTAAYPAPATHIIQKGEVFSVLAKKFNCSVADILKANNFKPNHILHVGDKISLPAEAYLTSPAPAEQQPAQKPPVTTAPPVVNAPAVTEKPATPVVEKPTAPVADGSQTIYVVKAKETLYSIGKKFNVKVAQLKTWNKLTGNNISTGQSLIVSAPGSTVAPQQDNNTAAQPPAPNTSAVVPQSQPTQKLDAPPVVTSSPAAKLNTSAKTNVPSAQPPVVQKQEPAINPASIPATGYFSTLFGKDVAGRSLKTANGKAMTFKTASGWNDKKYYVLMNDVPPGSVVQITTDEGKTVYARVLWNMGDEKDNDGLSFRISDAAATALNLKDSKFQIAVTYYE